MTETNRIEYKRQLNDDNKFEKEVVAFLNYKDGGVIYFGIDKGGAYYPIDDIDGTQLKIKDRIKKQYRTINYGAF